MYLEKKEGVYSEKKEVLGEGRWEIIKKVRKNTILINIYIYIYNR